MMFSPLVLVGIILMMKVINMLRKEGTGIITCCPLRCMVTFRNINPKILMSIRSRKYYEKKHPLYGTNLFLVK